MVELSLVVPFRDEEAFAPQTLFSLRRNVDERVEMIFVDDDSSDRTPALLAEWADRLPRTRVLHPGRHLGLSGARNLGTAAAQGRYLTFLDGDDTLTPGHLGHLLDAIRRLGCDFVRTDHVRSTGCARTLRRLSHGPRDRVCPALSGIGDGHHASAVDSPNAWAGVYDRARLPARLLHFDEDLRTCEDRPWIWRLHLEADTFAVVGLHGVCYRRDVSGSLSRRRDAHQLDFLVAMDRIVAMAGGHAERRSLLPKAVRTAAAMVCWHLQHLADYEPAVAEELWSRAGALVRSLPGPVLTDTLATLGDDRVDTLRRVAA